MLPFVSDLNCTTKGAGGVIDENGQYVAISSTSQENLMPCGYAVDKEPKYYEETAIYLGYYIMQWGHFLVDFVPRLWLLRQHYHGEKLLVLTSNRKSKINGNYLELLSLFGISEDKIHYVYEPEKYSRIIVPEMSMVRPAYYSEQSQELFHYIVEKAIDLGKYKKYEKIYFSRSKLKKAVMTEIGEPEIERVYRKNGYKIIYPERCSFKELVFYISNCKEFVSLSGTIPHNIVFARPGTKVVILNKTYRINTIQLMLNGLSFTEAAKHLGMTRQNLTGIYNAAIYKIRNLTKQASQKTYIGGLTKECVDAFVSMVYLYDDQTMKVEFNCEDVIRRALEKYGA